MRLGLISALGGLGLAACAPTPAKGSAELLKELADPGVYEPSHPPTTIEQWASAEAAARAAAAKAGSQELAAPIHVVGQGLQVEHRIAVVGGKCYRAGLAWTYGGSLLARVTFEGRENTQVSAREEEIASPAGVLSFCTDNSGFAVLRLAALTPRRAMAMAERLEYALVVGAHAESEEQGQARRKEEAASAAAVNAKIEGNVAAARARDEANRADRCKRCDREYRACETGATHRRQHPSPGVASSASCESQFVLCSHGNSYHDAQRRSDQRPCGDPPR